MSRVVCRGLAKSFGALRAVDDLELAVEPGSICALLGPSGCGKTTTLRLIAGFERPDAGEITVAGRVVAGAGGHVAPERRRIGMVFQDYALFPHHDVAGNVAFGLEGHGAGILARVRGRAGAARDRVEEVLELVGLGGLGERGVHELSGGQQQRVAVARALAPAPEVVLLDEPFSNLDAGLRDRLRRELREILLRAGTTSIFVTHDQEEALSLADTVAVMNAGRVEQVGSPEEVYGLPATRWVAGFLGDTIVLPATARRGGVECELEGVDAAPGFEGPADVLVRPEGVALAGGPAPEGTTPAVVVGRRFYGHDALLEVELPSGRRVHSRVLGLPPLRAGDRVHAWAEGPVQVVPRAS